MAFVLACSLGCFLFVWLAVYVALGGAWADAALAQRLSVLVPLRARLLLRRMATSRMVGELLDINAVVHLCDDVVLKMGTVGLSPLREEVCAALLAVGVVTCVVGCWMSRSLVAAPALAAASGLALASWDTTRQRRAEAELAASMPGVFRTLAMALGSGETLSQAISYVGAHESGEAGRAFHRAALRLRCGEPTDSTLDRLVEELDAPGVSLLAAALQISQRTGSPLRGLFQHSAALVERQGELERTLSVKTAQVRLSVRIVSLLPAILVVTLSLISPDFRVGVLTPTGLTCLLLATAMDAAALVIIRSLMRGVL